MRSATETVQDGPRVVRLAHNVNQLRIMHEDGRTVQLQQLPQLVRRQLGAQDHHIGAGASAGPTASANPRWLRASTATVCPARTPYRMVSPPAIAVIRSCSSPKVISPWSSTIATDPGLRAAAIATDVEIDPPVVEYGGPDR